MIAAAKRIPNFAGIALVDILANGVAVLIIVIVLSIASRSEQDKQISEQIREVSTVMTREFSTSLVLNRLAAGPPALLHDYENSELDQIWDPYVMPVLEIHRDSVRDPYSGKTWFKSELLREPNSLDTFLSEMDALQKSAIRGDFYDVGTYYLLMSILKDHQINIAHWHFIGRGGDGVLANPSLCPPGVSAQHCSTETAGQGATEFPDLLESLEGDDEGNGGIQNGEGEWPPSQLEQGNQAGRVSGNDVVPRGSQLSTAGEGDSLEAGSFPDAREVRDRLFRSGQSGRGQGAGQPGGMPSRGGMSIRLADPTARPLSGEETGLGTLIQSPAQLLAATMVYLNDIQIRLDEGKPPTQQIQQFLTRLMAAAARTDTLSEDQQAIIEDLALALSIRAQHVDGPDTPEPLLLLPLAASAHPEALVRVPINRVISEAEIQSNNQGLLLSLPDTGRVRFAMQAYPDIWRGLQIAIERNTILMMSPLQKDPETPRWRAIAYIAPQLDDLTVGFVYGRIQDGDQLEIVSESNFGLVATHSLVPTWYINPLSISAWQTAFYLVLGLLLIGLLLFWRPGVFFRR